MYELLDKIGIVAHRSEEFDPETKEVDYQVDFVIKLDTPEQDEVYATVTVKTNDVKLFRSFDTGKEYSLRFLEKVEAKLAVGMEN